MLLSEILSRFDDVTPERDGVVVRCPAHADSKPSLRIARGRQDGALLVKCRVGCETSKVLEAVGLTMTSIQNVTGLEAMPVAVSTSAPASPAAVASLALRLDGYASALDDRCREYAAQRFGLDAAACERLGLGLAEDLGGGPRLVVPFRVALDDDAPAHGFQARALEDVEAGKRWIGARSPKGGSWSKVGAFVGGSEWAEVVVTEGPGDALTAVGLGYDAVAIRGAGLAANAGVLDDVARIVGDRPVIVAGDGDDAGRAFSATLAKGLTDRGLVVRILDVPTGLDLTDWRETDPTGREIVRALQDAPIETSSTAALAVRDLRAYPMTDLGNAKFVRDYIGAQGSGVRYSPEAGFYLLDGGVWRSDRLDRTRAFTQDAAVVVAEIAETLRREAVGGSAAAVAEAKRWTSWAKHSQSRAGIDSALRELQALPGVAVDVNDFDRHAHLLAVRNGVVNLRTGDLLPSDPALLLTRRVEVDFDPAATAPRWEKFLEEVFVEHPALPTYVRRLVGYGITGETSEQAFAVLYGTGANGKSVFTDTLTEVFREITVTTPFSTFEERPSGGIPNDLAALKGARLVMAAEGEQGRPMAEAVLKRVTGRDLISARFMRREFFEFRPSFLLLLATNYKPNFRGQDEGLWRRVKLVPWDRYFRPEERDHRLGDALLREAPGILAWAVRGAVEWYRDGLRDPEVIRNGTVEYRETSDALAGFLPGVFVKELDAVTTGAVLWSQYLRWADEESLPQRERWTRKAFFAALEERGLDKRKRANGIVFVGVRRAHAADHVDGHDEPEPLEGTTLLAPPTTGADLDEAY